MIEPTTPEEDEAFNEIERQAKQRKEAVRATMRVIEEQKIMHRRGIGFLKPKSQQDGVFNEAERLSRVAQEIVRMTQNKETLLNDERNKVIEEVAQHIEKLTGFGQDTISSFAIYIRGMKK